MYDIVIPVKKAEVNEDLRYTLRSIDKFANNIRKVWLVGYSPSWVRNVEILPTNQISDKWINARRNIEQACRCGLISDDFILFNDDFILTEPVTDWLKFNSYYRGTLWEYECKYQRFTDKNVWREGFHFNRQLLILAGTQFDEPLNYEIHCPIVLNKDKRLHLFDRAEFNKYRNESDPLLFQRSIYLNLYPAEKQILIREEKLFNDVTNVEKLTENGFFSVSDNIIGNKDYKNINTFLSLNYERSRYERD